jgi:hypothetical protein
MPPPPAEKVHLPPTPSTQNTRLHPHKKALREAVANLYNDTYRKGKESQYTYENVCIVPGGRAGLSRVAAVIGDVYTVSVFIQPGVRRYRLWWLILSCCASF